jgi:hypothetical protein
LSPCLVFAPPGREAQEKWRRGERRRHGLKARATWDA